MTMRLSILAVLLLSGCAGMTDKLSRVNQTPPQSQVPLTAMPMPEPQSDIRMANSLWSTGRQTFFKDQRARTVGDILTVNVEIADSAELENETTRNRTATEEADATAVLGLEGYIGKILPSGVDPTNLANVGSTTTNSGNGEIEREETISLTLAAVVTQILPNGNMVIKGNQEVLVNYENRVLNLAGVIRPEDISIDNTISYDKIAEARIAYGGKGQITDLQTPRYGQQVLEAVLPF